MSSPPDQAAGAELPKKAARTSQEAPRYEQSMLPNMEALVEKLMSVPVVAERARQNLHDLTLTYGHWYCGIHGPGPALRKLGEVFRKFGIQVQFECRYAVEREEKIVALVKGMDPRDVPPPDAIRHGRRLVVGQLPASP